MKTVKTILLLGIGVLCGTGQALGQVGTLGLYTDPAGTDCRLIDASSGMVSVYVVHDATQGASGVSFSAPMPACMNGATWIGDDRRYPVTFGSSQDGISIGYGRCETGPTHVLTVIYFAAGTSSSCCLYPVVDNPIFTSGQIEVTNCDTKDLRIVYGTIGIVSTVNGDANCDCIVQATAGRQESSWGQVKSLYVTE